jgi:FkbM family methyltransferase
MPTSDTLRERLRRIRRGLRTWRGRDLKLRLDANLPAVRLGSEYGGWWVLSSTPRDCTVVSVGVGTDISFDLAMIERFAATVHAFDPTPKSVEWIASQTLPTRFHFRPLGLAHFDGEMTFRLARADHTSYSSELEATAVVDEVRCPVRRLATLARDVGLGRIDVLKIDIEGGEYDAVPELLKSGPLPGQLLLELHYTDAGAQISRAAKLVDLVRDAGFKLFARSAVGRELSFVHGSGR